MEKPVPFYESQTGREKESMLRKIMRFFFVFFNIIFMIIGMFMIMTGTVLWVVFRSSGLSITEVAGGCALGKFNYDKMQ